LTLFKSSFWTSKPFWIAFKTFWILWSVSPKPCRKFADAAKDLLSLFSFLACNPSTVTEEPIPSFIALAVCNWLNLAYASETAFLKPSKLWLLI